MAITLPKGTLSYVTINSFVQLVPIISMLVLAPLYGTAAYGEFSVYFAAYVIMAAVSAARLESLILHEHDSKKRNALASKSNSVVIIILFTFFPLAVVSDITLLERPAFISLSLVAASATAFNQIKINDFITTNRFRSANVLKALTVGCIALLQSLGLKYAPTFGLIFGHLIGSCVGSLICLGYYYKEQLKIFESKGLLRFIRERANYSIIHSIASLIGGGANQLPLFTVSLLGSSAVVGQFAMATRVVMLPVTLTSKQLSAALQTQIAKSGLDTQGKNLVSLGLLLFLIFSPIVTLFYLYSVDMFVALLGEEWRLSGSIAQILVFAAWARFIVSPMTGIFMLDGRQRLSLLWQLILLSGKLALFFIQLIGQIWGQDTILSLVYAALVVDVLAYAVGVALIYSQARGK